MEAGKRLSFEERAHGKPRKPESKPPSSEKRSRDDSAKEKSAREGSARTGSAREGSARKRSAREGSVTTGCAREGTARTGSTREGSARNGSVREGSARNMSVREGSARNGSSRQGSARDRSAINGSARDASARDGSARDGSARDGSARDGSARDGSARDGSARDGSARDGSARDASARDESARDESARDESARDESARDESARDESAREESARDGSARTGSGKDRPQSKGLQNRSSLIPIAKPEKIDFRGPHEKERKSYSSSKLCDAPLKVDNLKEDLENKLKLMEEKEKSIAQYYYKIHEMIRKLKKNGPKEAGKPKHRISNDSTARKMISEPLMFSKNKIESSILSDLENNVQEISKIWLRACTDLSCTLKNLKSNPSLEPMEVELEKVKIQLAIKQTKSLTLLKTRNIIAEAKKLFRHREMIRTKLERFISDNLINEFGRNLQKKDRSTSLEIEEKPKVGGTGDSHSDLESQELSLSCKEGTSSENEGAETPGTEEECFTEGEGSPLREDSSSEEKYKNSEVKRCISRASQPRSRSGSCENWTRDLAKKNETITGLNNRIFDLQKTCNEHALKYSQLQLVLSQFEEKIKWNQVLWKQIGKLKDQIKSLSQRNKNLELQKSDLETRIMNLDQELERLFKLNHFLNQRKYLMKNRAGKNQRGEDEKNSESKTEKCDKELECSVGIDEKVLAEKQNAINQLKTILEVMRDQENFAQRQISVFQSKIEELEKHTKL